MYIEQTHSTSSLLREMYSDALPHLYTIRTGFQTAGRGQAGNSWESEEGKNLLCSVLLKYEGVSAKEQWRISMLVAVALREAIIKVFGTEERFSNKLTIKWPNDIYYENKKLVGILIENMLQGTKVEYTIAGVGVNVNQTQWRSDAPNPISMKEITGEEYDVEALLNEWIISMKSWEECSTHAIRTAYLQNLYRREGWHKYVEREVSVEPTMIATQEVKGTFLAECIGVTEQGELVLRPENGEQKAYHFKQIRFVL